MSKVLYKTLEEVLHSVAEDGAEITAILELAKAGEEARVRDALAHMDKALTLYEQANAEAVAARINLSKAIFDVDIRWKLREPGTEEMSLRVRAARAALLGEDGPGIRRRKAREKAASQCQSEDSPAVQSTEDSPRD